VVAFQYALPSGIPGAPNRIGAGNTTEAAIIMRTQPPTFYGQVVVIEPSNGQVRPPNASDPATPAFYGLYVRPYPTHATQDALGVDTPPTQGEANIMKRGYMLVRLFGAGQAAKGAPVHVGTQAAVAPNVIGGITASPIGAGIVALGNPGTTYFMGPADATGMVEIAFNI
jgi:hypothetical protein